MKMSLLDLSWFLLESEAIPVHGGFLYVFSPPAGAKPGHADRIFAAMSKRPVGAPLRTCVRIFRSRRCRSWEEVDADLSQHVFRERLPSPGTERQLLAAAARQSDPPLPSSAPLWRFTWFDGLEGGRFAFLITLAPCAMGRRFDVPADGRDIAGLAAGADRSRAVGRVVHLAASRRAEGRWPQRAAQGDASGYRSPFARSPRSARHLQTTGPGLITGSTRRAVPFGAPETRPTRHGSNLRTYGLSRLPLESRQGAGQGERKLRERCTNGRRRRRLP